MCTCTAVIEHAHIAVISLTYMSALPLSDMPILPLSDMSTLPLSDMSTLSRISAGAGVGRVVALDNRQWRVVDIRSLTGDEWSYPAYCYSGDYLTRG